MSLPTDLPIVEADLPALRESLRAAIELLERVAADRALMGALDSLERRRLLQAAGEVFHPDPAGRRRLVKTIQRLRRAERTRRDRETLADTGIRALRRQTIFTTPEGFPAKAATSPSLLAACCSYSAIAACLL